MFGKSCVQKNVPFNLKRHFSPSSCRCETTWCSPPSKAVLHKLKSSPIKRNKISFASQLEKNAGNFISHIFRLPRLFRCFVTKCKRNKIEADMKWRALGTIQFVLHAKMHFQDCFVGDVRSERRGTLEGCKWILSSKIELCNLLFRIRSHHLVLSSIWWFKEFKIIPPLFPLSSRPNYAIDHKIL